MHQCIRYGVGESSSYGEEYSWSIALYIEVNISSGGVVVCQHPSFTVFEDLVSLAKSIWGIEGDEFTTVKAVAELLDAEFPTWRRDFEVVLRRNFVSITVYL
ncbi:MAG: hypothetical protein RMI45_08845 [Ignisphaera sp.]|nr:hypothetical protein [Ignisphaera sp.]MDW8086324.1 hypothetical protein [Ignisphaera sp.]